MLVVMLVSQPLVTLPSQLSKLALQLPIPQLLAAQPGVPLATAAHTLPHVPQLLALTAVSVSQPSTGPALQVRKLPVHIVEVQLPAEHAGVVAPTLLQTFPQFPQLPRSLAPLVSHPSLASPLQSRYSPWQLSWHLP
jgi:hypothetical protein